ncbi:MAG TPA: ABC transporter substrate-binding protein [Pseudolabrys sp.]|nr:ABC transporter substrate-binding protein [Pseudolabrys sp.]
MMAGTIKVIVFPGGFNLPLWTGIERQFFKSYGLDVEPHYTVNSVEQLSGMIAGRWEIALTGFDNIVAYQEGQGEAKIDVTPDLFAFMGGDTAFLRLVVQPDIASYADLKGKTLSVDALTTGFAFVLRKMLAHNGLSESEVSFERAGGALQRFEALKAGKHAGTLLVTPFDLIGKQSGLRVLQNASEVLPHYQGISGAARRSWAKDNADTLTAFISGYLDALDWLYASGNKQAACELLAAKVPGMSPLLAASTYDVLLDRKAGFDRKAALDIKGIETVLALRSEYGRPVKNLSDARKYDDPSYYQAARASR